MYAKVIIEYPIKSLDKFFTYLVPDNFKKIIKVGMKVKVPFNTKLLNGIVLKLEDNFNENYEIKEINSIVSPEFYLNEEQIKIAHFLKEETLCPLITAFQTMLPSSLKVKNNSHDYNKYDIFIKLKDDNYIKYIEKYPRKKKQIKIINELIKEKKLKSTYPSNMVKILKDNDIIEYEYVLKYRINNNSEKKNKLVLNDEQYNAYKMVMDSLNDYNVFLLQGITGSGKTEVYMQIIEEVIKSGKTALVLVPEICLTTQTTKRFYERFGSDVAIFHSGLSDGEKYDEYQKIYKDEVKIVVGTRSSVFVPLKNLGIIIIDEEHSQTYKQDSNPRYDARNVANFRCKNNNIPLILASATPSLESKARCTKNIYNLLILSKRTGESTLPTVKLINMIDEIKHRNFIYSDELIKKIGDRLEKKEQIILLLNRRGFSTFISCTNCGFTYKCPNCDITLTYHKTSNNLRCHYCGYFIKKEDLCPSCHENGLNYLGLGTEKAEEELIKIFPNAKILRMDQDTTSKKGSYQRIIDAFDNHEYDILLGTQMISKGLDFKNVTLVGVLNADTSLNIPDFRANERTFELLYQTSGRAGRSNLLGEVLIQTFNPDNEVLKYVQNNDYNNFYLYEMNIRHKLKYPPYVYIALIVIKGKNYETVSNEANKIKNMLVGKIDKKSIILGPTPAGVFKVNNIYHFQISIKYTFDDMIKKVLKDIDELYILNKDVQIEITFNPNKF